MIHALLWGVPLTRCQESLPLVAHSWVPPVASQALSSSHLLLFACIGRISSSIPCFPSQPSSSALTWSLTQHQQTTSLLTFPLCIFGGDCTFSEGDAHVELSPFKADYSHTHFTPTYATGHFWPNHFYSEDGDDENRRHLQEAAMVQQQKSIQEG